MKKSIYFLAAAVALTMALTGCEKEETSPADTNPTDTNQPVDPPQTGVAGDYDMTIVYDSVCTDGSWFENGYMHIPNLTYADEHGRMHVSQTDAGTISIEGTTVYSNGEEENTYFTTATRNADGSYNAQPSSYSVETLNFSVSYRTVTFNGDTMLFQAVETFEMGSIPMAYLRTITCVKH